MKFLFLKFQSLWEQLLNPQCSLQGSDCCATEQACLNIFDYLRPSSSNALRSPILSSIFGLNVIKLEGIRILHKHLRAIIWHSSIVCPNSQKFEFIRKCIQKRTRNNGHSTQFTLSRAIAFKQAPQKIWCNGVSKLVCHVNWSGLQPLMSFVIIIWLWAVHFDAFDISSDGFLIVSTTPLVYSQVCYVLPCG